MSACSELGRVVNVCERTGRHGQNMKGLLTIADRFSQVSPEGQRDREGEHEREQRRNGQGLHLQRARRRCRRCMGREISPHFVVAVRSSVELAAADG